MRKDSVIGRIEGELALKNRIVGLIVVLGGVLLMGVAVRALFTDHRPKLRFVASSATFLGQGDPVKFNGVKIGQIEDVLPTRDGIQYIASLESDVCVPKSASVVVGSAGILGQREVQIRSEGSGADCFAQGEPIGIKESGPERRNLLGEWIQAPEKLDTVIAILRRLEEAQERGARK